MEFVDQTSPHILLNRCHSTTKANIHITCRRSGTVEGRMYSFRDEMKRGAAGHRDGRTRMMRQHEGRCVKRRVLTPPAFPVLIRPRAAKRAEHVAAQNPRADVLDTARGEIIVYSSGARVLAVQQL